MFYYGRIWDLLHLIWGMRFVRSRLPIGGFTMKIEVDVDQLRESLLDRAGSAAGVGFPAAMLDVMDIEDESPQELLARAEREGLDLCDFAVDGDADDDYGADEEW